MSSTEKEGREEAKKERMDVKQGTWLNEEIEGGWCKIEPHGED